MEYINKTVFINYLSCPTLGWLTKRNKIPKLTGLNNDFLIYENKIVRQKAWQLFKNSVVVQKSEDIDVFLQTRDLIANYKIDAICNAYFFVEGYYVKADILKRVGQNSWHLFEVKSGNKCKAKYTNDIAFTAMVLLKTNMSISKYSVLHLSNDYRLGMPIENLFVEIDSTEKVELKLLDFFPIYNQALNDINSDNMPEPYLKRRCKNCPVFNTCMGSNVKNHIFDLPKLSIPAMKELITLKIDTIGKIPDDFKLTKMQKIVKNSVLTNTNYVSDTLSDELNNIKQPYYYYLDFESVTTIMPLYPNVAPQTQILTQFSLDKTDNKGNILNHYEYIADHTKDCRREIALYLIEYLKQDGSIITYSNSERISILKLADLFEDLSDGLNKVAERIVDLELILEKNYYDLNFHGRSSIKKVLPILIPKETYLDLEIGDGGDAAASFAFMALGMYDKEQIEKTRKSLLEYCAKDTIAMIYIHQFLIDVINNKVIK